MKNRACIPILGELNEKLSAYIRTKEYSRMQHLPIMSPAYAEYVVRKNTISQTIRDRAQFILQNAKSIQHVWDSVEEIDILAESQGGVWVHMRDLMDLVGEHRNRGATVRFHSFGEVKSATANVALNLKTNHISCLPTTLFEWHLPKHLDQEQIESAPSSRAYMNLAGNYREQILHLLQFFIQQPAALRTVGPKISSAFFLDSTSGDKECAKILDLLMEEGDIDGDKFVADAQGIFPLFNKDALLSMKGSELAQLQYARLYPDIQTAVANFEQTTEQKIHLGKTDTPWDIFFTNGAIVDDARKQGLEITYSTEDDFSLGLPAHQVDRGPELLAIVKKWEKK